MSGLRNILKTLAPTLAAALGGPLAGVATKFIADRLGGGDAPKDTHLESYIEQLLGNAENLHKLKEIDQQFKQEMQKLNVDVFSLEVQDRQSARELAQKSIWIQGTASIAFLTAYFGILIWVFYAEISPDIQPGMYKNDQGEFVAQSESLMDVFQVLLGVLTAGVAQILNFWFGGLFGRREQQSD
jgi:hypothetical protein